MNRLESTLVQNKAIATINMMRETDKFVRRLYQSRQPLGTANKALEKHLIAEGLAFRQNGPLLALTYKGKRSPGRSEHEPVDRRMDRQVR